MEFHGQERRCQHAGIRTPHIKQASPGLSGCEGLGDKSRTDRTYLPQEGGWGGRDEGYTSNILTGPLIEKEMERIISFFSFHFKQGDG